MKLNLRKQYFILVFRFQVTILIFVTNYCFSYTNMIYYPFSMTYLLFKRLYETILKKWFKVHVFKLGPDIDRIR